MNPKAFLSFHPKKLFLLFMLIIFAFRLSSEQDTTNTDFRFRYFTTEPKKKLHSQGNATSVPAASRMQCAQRCTSLGYACMSVNFKTTSNYGFHLCELLSNNKYGLPANFESSTEFDHMWFEIPTPSTCADVYEDSGRQSGVYQIAPSPSLRLQVYCDLGTNKSGWIVIQRRIDGSVNFQLNWTDYKRGFGNKQGEYWLGLDNLHVMTSQRKYRLRFDMADFEGNTRYAEYDDFKVADEKDFYRLTYGKYEGNAGNSLKTHNNQQFTTKDRDNDINHGTNCAEFYTGAWWHNNCHETNPNGQYLNGNNTKEGKGITWMAWHGDYYSLKNMEMKIRPMG